MLKDPARSGVDHKIARVQIHPRVGQNKRALFLSLYCLGIYLLLLVIAIVYELIFHARSFLVPFLLANPNFLLWFGIMLLLMSIVSRGSIKYFEQKRQAVVRGEKQLLAEQQPGSLLSAQEIVVPIVLDYRIDQSKLLTIFLSATIVLLVILIVNTWLQFLGMTIASLFSVWLFLSAFCWWMWRFQPGHQLLADEHGLTLTQLRSQKVQTILWSDARLFAIDDVTSSDGRNKKTRPPFQFELASEQVVICWYGNLKEWPNVVSLNQPVLPMDEYMQQLQSLHALIVQKTGLPLVDLRNKY
ncbi:hypothetical protein KDH_35930 [Dictyobacter sp. S3.2.2.5]|uniref:YcxB-like protein domain-containing protein n=1 Tax=Dictyobacter halimunensis TaxID=3026934 RepID=A0ABQ6FR62_9CHLR|nr:hypothetical protein KDH_35930 [Dictyobacter sp. S3.2.2.5]